MGGLIGPDLSPNSYWQYQGSLKEQNRSSEHLSIYFKEFIKPSYIEIIATAESDLRAENLTVARPLRPGVSKVEVVPQWLSHSGENKNPVASQSTRLGCLINPKLVLKTWRVMEATLGLSHGRLRNTGSVISEAFSSNNNGVNQLGSKREGRVSKWK